MKRLVFIITTVLVLISGAFAQSNPNPNPNPNEEQQNQLVENLAEKLYGLAEAQLNAIQSIIEDPSYYTYQKPTLTPGERKVNNGISMSDGVHAIYCRHLDEFCFLTIEQGSIEMVTPNDEVVYQGWIVDKYCVELDDGSRYLKITFLNGTYYEDIYISYYINADPETGAKKVAKYYGKPVYYMD